MGLWFDTSTLYGWTEFFQKKFFKAKFLWIEVRGRFHIFVCVKNMNIISNGSNSVLSKFDGIWLNNLNTTY